MEPPRKKARRSAPDTSEESKSAALSSLKGNANYRRHMYLTFVKNALVERRMGRTRPYEELVGNFAEASKPDSNVSFEQLRAWLDALSHVVSQLDRMYSGLVDAVLALPWSTSDDAFVQSYTTFVGLLISARPEYIATVLDSNVRGFTYNSGLRAVDAVNKDGAAPMTRGRVYDRQHSLTTHLLSLIPTLPASLLPVLTKYFPHKREPKVAQVTYIRNLLVVGQYCPPLSGRILGLVVERAVMIDVEVQIAYEDLENTSGEEGVFELDPFDQLIGDSTEVDEDDGDEDDDDGLDLDDLSSDGEGGSDEEHEDDKFTPSNEKNAAIHAMIAKLDGILRHLFQYFERIGLPHKADSESGAESSAMTSQASSMEARLRRLRPQFAHLLGIFDRTILPTFRTRYTQFLLFYFTSLDPTFADHFQGLLLSKALLEPDQSSVVRLASVSYIAGYVSRAKCVGRESCRRVVELLCEALTRRLELDDEEVDEAGGETFYAVAQALMVIFCFRWRDLRDESSEPDEALDQELDASRISTSGNGWMPELSVMPRAVTSHFNPLKYCFKHVVTQFAAVANHTNFLYCHSIIEANRRSRAESNDNGLEKSISSDALASIRLAQVTHLDSFFPFDPYTLPATEGYIAKLYRTWTDVRPEGFEEEEEDADGDEDPIINGDPLGGQLNNHTRASSTGLDAEVDRAADALGKSFGGLSISPMGEMRHSVGSDL